MRRFSRLAFERSIGQQASDYVACLLPVELSDGSFVQTMILGERFTDLDMEAFLVTNYCTKFAPSAINHYREASGHFKVMNVETVGDETIVFQLSRRL